MTATSLKHIPLFSQLSDAHLEALGGVCGLSRRQAGSTVFSEGDLEEVLYVIRSGRVAVTKATPTGEQKFIREMGPGESFGEMSIIDPAPRSATVTTLAHTEMLTLGRVEFRRLIEQHPPIAMQVMVHLVRRIRQLDGRLDTSKPVRERLLEVLQDLALHETPIDGFVTLRVKRQVLAERCDARRETVSRELSRLRDAGLIEMEGGRLRFKRPG